MKPAHISHIVKQLEDNITEDRIIEIETKAKIYKINSRNIITIIYDDKYNESMLEIRDSNFNNLLFISGPTITTISIRKVNKNEKNANQHLRN